MCGDITGMEGMCTTLKRMLYLVSTLGRTGPTNQLYNIIKHLDKSRFNPMLVTLSPEPADSRWSDFEKLGIDVRSLGLSRLKGLFLAKGRLARLVSDFAPDVIHSQGIRADALNSSLSGNFKRIATIRNLPQLDYSMKYGPLKGKVMTGQHVKSLKQLDLCVGVSEAVSENLGKRFSISNVATIPNGVDDEVFYPPDSKKKYELRQKQGLPDEGDVWISSGLLSTGKDPLFLVSTWKAMGDYRKYLVFIGNGSLYDECIKAAEGSSNIIFRGKVPNVADYLKASDFFVSSSETEGLPNSVLEAMACGLPVLLSDIDPHKEIWNIDPSVGALFELGNAEDFMRCFQDVQARCREPMSQAAIALIKNHLSARRMSGKYQILYDEICNGITKNEF